MQRRDCFQRAAAMGLVLAGLSPAARAAVSQADAGSGIRTALERGAVFAVEQLGRSDGFLGNDKVRIPLPGFLNSAAKILKATGQGRRVDELVTAMNRAAEAAVPEAKGLLVAAARDITVQDALRIVQGGATSATDYFSGRTRPTLQTRFLPIVQRATEKVALAERYDAVASKASNLGLMKKEDANLQQYVTGKALDGLFFMIGEEEKKIRADPVGTGSRILGAVFGR